MGISWGSTYNMIKIQEQVTFAKNSFGIDLNHLSE